MGTSAQEDTLVEAEGAYTWTDLGIWQNGAQILNSFFIYDKVDYRIEATEPLTEFHIDWDDGDDNSPEKGNIEIIKLEEPSFFATAEHVYTTHGSHYPVVRAKGVNGYLSKYYTAYEDEGVFKTKLAQPSNTILEGTGEGTVAPTTFIVLSSTNIVATNYIRLGEEYMKVVSVNGTELTVTRGVLGSDIQQHAHNSFVWLCTGKNQNDFNALETLDIGSGQNDYSLVSIDHITSHKLPVFRPANRPPIAILKADRNRIQSGINNEVLEGTSVVHVDGTGCSSTAGNGPRVKITYVLETATDSQIIEVTKRDEETIANVTKILKVELVNLKEAKTTTAQTMMADERIYIRQTNATGDVICNVSLGNPIVKESEAKNRAILDLSESRTRASNVSISEYYIDDGHHTTGSTRWAITTELQEAATADASKQTGDTLHANFKVNYPTITVQHTFQPKSDPIGTDNRFLSKEILCRGQVKDSSSVTRVDTGDGYTSTASGDTIEYSYIDHDEISEYYTVGSGNPFSGMRPRPDALRSSNVLAGAVLRDDPTFLNKITVNKEVDTFLLGGNVTPGGTDAEAQAFNYFLLSRKDKFDRLFIKTLNNHTANPPTIGTTMPNYRLTIFYPTKNYAGNYVWKPLAFKDTTKYENQAASSLMRDGTLSFRPPLDWEKVESTDMNSWPFGTLWDTKTDAFWIEKGYALIIGMATKATGGAWTPANHGITFMKPYTNAHSQLLTMLDPTHISLNTKTIAQAITFSRQGLYNVLTNKLGKSEIRKISASGGKITFGGIDLATDTTRKDVKEYQQNGTPVYIDIEHRNGDFTRFFGVIQSMSEDHPTGKMVPKFGLSMIISHIIEFDSSGTKLSNDYISLGGNVDYESEYLQ